MAASSSSVPVSIPEAENRSTNVQESLRSQPDFSIFHKSNLKSIPECKIPFIELFPGPPSSLPVFASSLQAFVPASTYATTAVSPTTSLAETQPSHINKTNLNFDPELKGKTKTKTEGTQRTLIYIHGATSTPLEISLVYPYLKDWFHMLVPAISLTATGQPSPTPFTIDSTVDELHALIERKGIGGTAVVFGFSMGGHIALALAAKYPAVCEMVVASGINLVSRMPAWKQMGMRYVFWWEQVGLRSLLSKGMLKSLGIKYLRPADEGILDEMVNAPQIAGWTLISEICSELLGHLKEPQRFESGKEKLRVLIVVGTSDKGGFGDNVEDAKVLVTEIREEGVECVGVEVVEGNHPWLIQLPELCASLIRSWVDGGEWPQGIKVLPY